jgi:hypothetical protein
MMSTYSRPALAIQPDVTQILPEKPEPFAEKKDGDERQNDNGDERVAAEKGLDEIVGAPAANVIGATIGGAATTSAILQSWRLGNGGGKCRSVTIALQFRQGIWQNDANRCSLPDHALRFNPAAVQLRNMFYDR